MGMAAMEIAQSAFQSMPSIFGDMIFKQKNFCGLIFLSRRGRKISVVPMAGLEPALERF
jgi:hypothetical protein